MLDLGQPASDHPQGSQWYCRVGSIGSRVKRWCPLFFALKKETIISMFQRLTPQRLLTPNASFGLILSFGSHVNNKGNKCNPSSSTPMDLKSRQVEKQIKEIEWNAVNPSLYSPSFPSSLHLLMRGVITPPPGSHPLLHPIISTNPPSLHPSLYLLMRGVITHPQLPIRLCT